MCFNRTIYATLRLKSVKSDKGDIKEDFVTSPLYNLFRTFVGFLA